MVLQRQADRGKGGLLHRKSGLRWVFCRQLADLRSLIAIFMFLFLLAMPIAMLILGRDIFTGIANRCTLPYHDPEGITVLYFFGKPLLFNDALVPLHLLVVTLSSVAVLMMGGSLFRPLYRRDTVDFEWSLPITKSQWFLGRALALVAGISLIFLVNIAATSGIIHEWGLKDIFADYLLVYLKTYLSTIVFAGFSLVTFSLAGRLFDAIVLKILIHLVLPFTLGMLFITGSMYQQSVFHKLVWIFAPAFDTYRTIFVDRSFFYYAALILFWFVFGWFCAMNRTAEWGERKMGTMRWFQGVQLVFTAAAGLLSGNFFYAFDSAYMSYPDLTKLQSPAFFIGAVLGAFLGQLFSSAITGKPLQRVPGEDSGKRRLHPVLCEWLWSLLGVVITCSLVLLSRV